MSDYGDFCREQRQRKQALRRHWHECPTCRIRFGTGTSVAPGAKCRNCGWVAPGQRGDDEREADRFDKMLKRAKRFPSQRPKCPKCGKVLKSKAGLKHHMRDKHERVSAAVSAAPVPAADAKSLK